MKVQITGASAFVNRMFEACGSYQWAREFLKNSLEAEASKVEFGIEWQASSSSPLAMGYFAAASTVIAIPTGMQVVGWVATLWNGRPLWRTPLLFGLAGLIIFVLGGITGVMVASPPFDLQRRWRGSSDRRA